ncbi:RNA methyltransferase [Desulfogranum japonicum]|uniref:RNA methyltransferase n=1 Tax=Desulfogranum japonicum TaxID=231447 RepID=UPI0004164513|nr:RNA methyltransferase [Desulfogranum japonicum]
MTGLTQHHSTLEVVLVHWPVVNKHGDIIGSAVTNLDIHDIARACKTFGVHRYWIVTPFDEQQKLVGEITRHWTSGYGAKANPDRQNALELVHVRTSIDEVVDEMQGYYGVNPQTIVTCASPQANMLGYDEVKKNITEDRPVLLMFGTAWGLAPEMMHKADATLPPIRGEGEFNHLSVRSAVSIILDRLLGKY